jgi:MFS family permease
MSRNNRYPPSFWLIITANLFLSAGFQWTFATLPGYVQHIGGDAAQLGLAFALLSLTALAARPGVGWLVDRWGRKPVLLTGALIFSLSPLLYAWSSSLWPFMAVRVLHGVGIAAFSTAYLTIVGDLAPAARRGEAVGLSGVTSNLAMLFAPALGAYVATAWGYAAHFVASAIISAVSVVLLLPVVEPSSAVSSRGGGPGLPSVARVRLVWVASFTITGLSVAYGAVLSFLPPLASERDLTATGGYYTAFAAAMMLAQAAAGWLSDRVGRRTVAIPGLLLVVPAMAVLALARTDAALLVAGAIFGSGWGLARAGLDTSVVEAVTAEARGSAVGILYASFDIGVGAGSFGLGLVAQAWSYAAAFYAAASWAVVALAGYLGWGRPKRRANAPPIPADIPDP